MGHGGTPEDSLGVSEPIGLLCTNRKTIKSQGYPGRPAMKKQANRAPSKKNRDKALQRKPTRTIKISQIQKSKNPTIPNMGQAQFKARNSHSYQPHKDQRSKESTSSSTLSIPGFSTNERGCSRAQHGIMARMRERGLSIQDDP
jgi:hypothetical protein